MRINGLKRYSIGTHIGAQRSPGNKFGPVVRMTHDPYVVCPLLSSFIPVMHSTPFLSLP